MPATRRDLLKGAAILALPRCVRAADPPSLVIAQLSAYMAAAGGRALPAEALEYTKHHIIDTVAAMVSGTELPPGKVALAMARAQAGLTT